MNDNKQERGFKKLKSGRLLEIMVVVIIVVIVAIVLYNFLTRRLLKRNWVRCFRISKARAKCPS